ncbi:MAG: STAS domain-containing protein [Planctomycetota bacterium]
MEINFQETDDNVLVVNLDGGIDSTTAKELNEALTKMVDTGFDRIVVDCSKLNYISSLGIGTLVTLHRRLKKRGGDVKLACLYGTVWDVFKISKLDLIFNIFDDVSRARLAFREKTPVDPR